MNGHRARRRTRLAVEPADVLIGLGDSRQERREVGGVPARWDLMNQLLTEHELALRVLDVDDWRFAGDRDRLFERADAHVGVDRCREGPGQLDALALDGIEAGKS